MPDNETRENLINTIRELIEIVRKEMSSEWSREFIEEKLSKYTALLKEIEGSKNDNLKF